MLTARAATRVGDRAGVVGRGCRDCDAGGRRAVVGEKEVAGAGEAAGEREDAGASIPNVSPPAPSLTAPEIVVADPTWVIVRAPASWVIEP